MPRMYKQDGGYNNFTESEVEAAQVDGWKIVTDDEWNQIIKAKAKSVAPITEPVTIQEQPQKAGRRGKFL